MAGFDLARRLRAGETVYAAWCSFAAPMVAETVARGGFAAVVLDMQHGLWDTGSIIAGIGAVDHAGASPVVRVPLNDFAFVSRALDFRRRRHHRADDQQRRRCSEIRRGGEISAARRAQLGPATRHDAAGQDRDRRLSARGQ